MTVRNIGRSPVTSLFPLSRTGSTPSKLVGTPEAGSQTDGEHREAPCGRLPAICNKGLSMNNTISEYTEQSSHQGPEERLADSVAAALRASGLPPLQYLEVSARDGHIYLVARVPALFLERHTAGPE